MLSMISRTDTQWTTGIRRNTYNSRSTQMWFPFQTASIVPQNKILQISGGGPWKSLEIYPAPDVTILLE